MTRYIIRLDDAHSQHDQEKWDRIESLLDKHQVRPIVAVIPDNKDEGITPKNGQNFDLWEKVRSWEAKGWKIAIHGLNHLLTPSSESILPTSIYSEFSGKSFEEQTAILEKAIDIFKKHGCTPNYFVAPCHGFDSTTLTSIKQASIPLVVSDLFGYRPITKDDIQYIPQQFWHPRSMPFGTWTICLHPSGLSEIEYSQLDLFLSKHRACFDFNLDQIIFVPYSATDYLCELAYLTYFKTRKYLKGLSALFNNHRLLSSMRQMILKKRWYSDTPTTSFTTKYLQSPAKKTLPFMVRSPFNTLIIDLHLNEDQILMGCTSNCRNEIKRGGREALEVTHGPVTTAYAEYFDDFLASKSLGRFNTDYINNPETVVSSVYRADCRIASHLYLVNNTVGRARLIYSVVASGAELPQLKPDPATGGMSTARLVGVANRYLHSEDILYFKRSGFNIYDFGGLGIDESNAKVKGINDFKRSFGGETISEFNYTPILVAAIEKAITLARKILK